MLRLSFAQAGRFKKDGRSWGSWMDLRGVRASGGGQTPKDSFLVHHRKLRYTLLDSSGRELPRVAPTKDDGPKDTRTQSTTTRSMDRRTTHVPADVDGEPRVLRHRHSTPDTCDTSSSSVTRTAVFFRSSRRCDHSSSCDPIKSVRFIVLFRSATTRPSESFQSRYFFPP
jgi:hypothetical protein